MSGGRVFFSKYPDRFRPFMRSMRCGWESCLTANTFSATLQLADLQMRLRVCARAHSGYARAWSVRTPVASRDPCFQFRGEQRWRACRSRWRACKVPRCVAHNRRLQLATNRRLSVDALGHILPGYAPRSACSKISRGPSGCPFAVGVSVPLTFRLVASVP